ncbi:hypothetical protein BDK92_4755 [Micromonospora pisi]|uniref:Amidohydrolase-related domain-containing protein n=1 Tax=Micromonospora pisi TaxID=589240 RepID=A0A495JN82_9ACTN|nr:amidohydrolase family protein [Micromonospora pisi]RKR90383.1 hypothetical protein BDK92_4755 [Micromonospora pisi]
MTRFFDFHARLGPAPGAVDRLLAAMDSAGIERAAVSAGGVLDLDQLSRQIVQGGHVETDADNRAVLAACQGSAGRLLPFFFGNPHRDPDDYRRHAAGYRGLEISPAVHGVPLTDRRTTALVEVAAEYGHPVYLVTLGRYGVRAPDLRTLAEKFPEVTFVLGHCGFIGIDTDAIARVAPNDNVVVETSGAFMLTVRIALDRLGADRVLFGTEHPLQHPEVELAKLRALDLDQDSMEKVAWRNAYRLLGEEIR